MMSQYGFAIADDFVTLITYSKADFNITKADCKILVEPSDGIEQVPFDHQTGGGYRAEVACDNGWDVTRSMPKVIGAPVGLTFQVMVCDTNTENNPRVLDGVIRVKKYRAYDAHIVAE